MCPVASQPNTHPFIESCQGSEWHEIVELAKAIEAAGASIINTGIGWHEGTLLHFSILTCLYYPPPFL